MRDSRILWDFDTGAGFASVNDGKTTGGSIDQGDQVIADGTLLVISGGRTGHYRNELLALAPDGQ